MQRLKKKILSCLQLLMQALKQRMLDRTSASPSPSRRLNNSANKENVDRSVGGGNSTAIVARPRDEDNIVVAAAAVIVPLDDTAGRLNRGQDQRRKTDRHPREGAESAADDTGAGVDKDAATPRSQRSSGKTATKETAAEEFARPAGRADRRHRSKSTTSRSR